MLHRFFSNVCNFLRKFASDKKKLQIRSTMLNLPWYAYLPVAAGIIGGIIGGYCYKKNHRDEIISDGALIVMGGCGAFHRIAALAQGDTDRRSVRRHKNTSNYRDKQVEGILAKKRTGRPGGDKLLAAQQSCRAAISITSRRVFIKR